MLKPLARSIPILFFTAFMLLVLSPDESLAWRVDNSVYELNIDNSGRVLLAQTDDTDETADGEDAGDDYYDDEFVDEFAQEDLAAIPDPLESFNRAMFVFNDKLYFWVLKPAAQGYSFIMPEPGRAAIGRFFTNLATPIRFVNSILQFKFEYAGTELLRFGINTTLGIAGLFDPARDSFDIYLHKEDFGQTLGHYGAGPGVFITWPIFGPSSIRDTVGLVGDFFLDPLTYIFAGKPYTGIAVKAGDKVNTTSLNIGVYEGLKKDALDPYTFIRDAWHQHRENLVKE